MLIKSINLVNRLNYIYIYIYLKNVHITHKSINNYLIKCNFRTRMKNITCTVDKYYIIHYQNC